MCHGTAKPTSSQWMDSPVRARRNTTPRSATPINQSPFLAPLYDPVMNTRIMCAIMSPMRRKLFQ